MALAAENRLRLGAFNMTLVMGEAPEAFEELPPPDCAFVGGSGGRLMEIFSALLRKNPAVRIAATAVTLETAALLSSCAGKLPLREEAFFQLSVSQSRKAGESRLMTANNPVYLAVFAGTGKEGSMPVQEAPKTDVPSEKEPGGRGREE